MAEIETRRNVDGKVTSYRVRWRVKVDGDWRRKTRSFDPTTQGRAQAKRFAAEVDIDGGRAAADVPDTDQITVRALVTGYLDDRSRSKRIKSERTVHDYARDARLHIYPPLGHRLADDLDTDTVQEWVDNLEKHGRDGSTVGRDGLPLGPAAPKTAHNVHATLAGAYKWGIRQRLVRVNPCEGTELPERGAIVPRGLRPGEWQLVHQAAVDTDPLAADVLLFLVSTGWRWSEAAALQVLELELDRDPPTVQVGRVFRRQPDGSTVLVEGDAKSRAGLRRVKLPAVAVDMLRRRAHGKALGDFVFTTSTGRPLHYSNFRRRLWRPVIDLATTRGLQVKPTIHWLRHTQVGLLLEVEKNLAAIQRRIGHADISTTIGVYGSLVDDISDESLAYLNAALTGETLGRPRLRAVRPY